MHERLIACYEAIADTVAQFADCVATAHLCEQAGVIGNCRDVGYIDGAMLDACNLVRQLETT